MDILDALTPTGCAKCGSALTQEHIGAHDKKKVTICAIGRKGDEMNPEIAKHNLSDGTPYFCCDCVKALEAECDNLRDKLARAVIERDRLKTELEDTKLNQVTLRLRLEEDRDHYRAMAEKCREALSVSRGQWIHSVNAKQCLESLALFDAKGEGNGSVH